MKSYAWVAAAGFATAVAGFAGPALAWPTTAYTSNMVALTQAACLGRATQAMAAEGWGDMRQSGGLGVLGHKEPSSAYILCLAANGGPLPVGAADNTTDVVIFVTSTSADTVLPAEEVARLQQRMIEPVAH